MPNEALAMNPNVPFYLFFKLRLPFCSVPYPTGLAYLTFVERCVGVFLKGWSWECRVLGSGGVTLPTKSARVFI